MSRNDRLDSFGYDATRAAAAYRVRRHACVRQHRLRSGTVLYQQVHDHLVYRRWSPQQIAAKLRRMRPDIPEIRRALRSVGNDYPKQQSMRRNDVTHQ